MKTSETPVLDELRESIASDAIIPIYYRLELALRQALSTGALKPGSKLPSEDHLAAWLHISRPTVRQTLSRLEDDQLIKRIQGKGTFVLDPPR